MKVLQVSSFAPPHLGGLETCAANLFQKIPDSSIEMTWLFSDVPSQPPQPHTIRVKAYNVVEDLSGIPVPIPGWSALNQIRLAVRKADLVHIHDAMYFNCLAAVIFANAYHKPILVTLHIGKVPYESVLVRLVQYIAHSTVAEYCLRQASAIVTYNRLLFGEAARFQKARRCFISNGIADVFLHHDITQQKYRQLRTALGIEQTSPVVIFAGRFAPKKGLPLIRTLAESMPEVLFLMCGAGSIDPGSWELENVHVLGQLDHERLRDYFLASDLLLLPSKGEGFPFAVPEAMACGLPCAILPETWSGFGERADLFLILQEDRIEPQVRELLGSSPQFEWRRDIAAFAQQAWSWDGAVERYRELYRWLADAH